LEFRRFAGKGPDQKPLGAGFYPEDLSQKEFYRHLKDHPEERDLFEKLIKIPKDLDLKFNLNL
jgi:hypothetical protein